MMTKEELKKILNYNPDDGLFIWLIAKAQCIKIGSFAGTVKEDGYLRIVISGKRYYAHRLAYFYMNGSWPQNDIDHKDGNKLNNKWNNLREATESQNLGNCKKYKSNTSGLKGVSWNKSEEKWMVRIQVNNKSKYLGSFRTLKECEGVYEKAAKELFGEYARTE